VLEAPSGDEETRTLEAVATRAGLILGTVAYMSPEQASGRVVDARSDIFSFGVVLYDLLGGRRPFTGASDLLVLQGILHGAPAPLGAPTTLRNIVEKALEKDPGERYQSMREVVIDLKRSERVSRAETVVAAAPAAAPRRRWMAPAAGVALLAGLGVTAWRLWRSEPAWENPLASAQLTRFTDFDGAELDAAISADGKFVAFLSDRDGPVDGWVSQVGSGEFRNLTKGRFPELLHEEVRSIGFSADASQVWLRVFRSDAPRPAAIWLMPTMGGVARPFLDDAPTAAWSADGSKVVYHEATGGDPMFIVDRNGGNRRQIFAEKPEGHCHHPTWSPDGQFVYFVRGSPFVNATDIWRVRAAGGEPERITRHDSRVVYPALIDERTLLYTAITEDGSGPWLYSIDVEQRIPHRVSFGLERYLSIAASGDGRRLVATVANPSANLWTAPISDGTVEESSVTRLSLPTVRAVAPAYGPDFVVYLSSRGGADGVWKLQDGVATELWKGSDGGVMAAPAVSPDGRQISFPVRKQDRTRLYVMTSDGTNPRALAPTLDVRGAAAWSSDAKSIVIAAEEGQGAHLFRVPVDGGPPVVLLREPSLNPVWSRDGRWMVFSGTTVGGSAPLKAIGADGAPIPLPEARVLAGGSRYRVLPDGRGVVVLRGGYRQQNFWLIDLTTGRQRQLTNLRPDYSLRSFDVSPDGKQILFDRVRENSDIVLIELARR